MKLIIQIPCYNEAGTLPATIAQLPAEVAGFDEVSLLVIDDGSTDGTSEVARLCGVSHILKLNGHQGLARAFMSGLVAAIELGGDVIVNTDADNQYNGKCVADLVLPILTGKADIVIGARPITQMSHFTRSKRTLQRIGTSVIRHITGMDIQDAPSGFRAFSREAACGVYVFGAFTYTIESLIQASMANIRIVSVPIEVNPPTRPSRLFKSSIVYIAKAVAATVSAYAIYRPMHIFAVASSVPLLMAIAIGMRFLYLNKMHGEVGHVQSLVLCAILSTMSFFLTSVGYIAYLLSINRRILEDARRRTLLGKKHQ